MGDDVVASGCGWPQGASFEVPGSWASGGYIVVLRGERDGREVTQDAFFVLRPAEPGRHCGLAMVAATYTWQEYNDWGGGCGYFSDERHADDIDRRTGAFEAHYIDRPPVATFGGNGLRGVYSRMGGLSPRGADGFIVYRPGHWAFAGADVCYGDVLGGDVPLVGYETDGLDYTFRAGLPYPTGADGTPEGLEILALTPVTLEEEYHGQAGNLISIADGDLAFAAEALFGEDTPSNRDRLRYGSAVITAMPKGRGEVFCAGTTEWCHALAQGDPQVETITRNVLDRFLD